MEISNLAGLPAHPLIVHAVVVLVPLTAIGVLLSAIWPAARNKIGWISLGFATLVLILVPVMAWWLNITLLDAFLLDLGFLAFFFIYTVVFTWVFDRVFGLPQAACA